MPTFRAALAVSRGAPLQIRDLRLDDPRPDEVLVRMHSVGVCHTDATVLGTSILPIAFPAVLGHEGAGKVIEVGSAVEHVVPGDSVVLSFGHCGLCRMCQHGHPAYCDRFDEHNFLGTRLDGSSTIFDGEQVVSGSFFGQSSFANLALANGSSVVRVDRNTDLSIAGPLGCGLLTGASAVRRILSAGEGDAFAVYGAGGVGFGALMMAKALGCDPIIAVDINTERLALARELGATHAIDGRSHDVHGQIQRATAATNGVHAAVETTGVDTVVRTGVETLRRGGHLVLNAPHRSTGQGLDVGALPSGITVSRTVMGDAVPSEIIPVMLQLHREGRFPFDRLIKTYDLEEIGQAFADAADGSTVKPVVQFPIPMLSERPTHD